MAIPLHPVLPEALDGSPTEIHAVTRRGGQFFPVSAEDPLGVGAVGSSSTLAWSAVMVWKTLGETHCVDTSLYEAILLVKWVILCLMALF